MSRKRLTVAEQIRLGAYFFTTGAIDLAIAQFAVATRLGKLTAKLLIF